jgi:hypothetical protein
MNYSARAISTYPILAYMPRQAALRVQGRQDYPVYQ